MSDQPPPHEDAAPLQISGSSVVPLYVERKMKIYAVPEFEFDSLASRNTQATTFFSVGSFLLSAAISIWINAIFYTDVPPAAVIAKTYVAPLGVLLACVFFGLAWQATKSRKSSWERIKDESVSR